MNDLMTFMLGLLGALLFYLYKKRKFDRTNEYGIEHFPSVLHKLKSSMLDHALRITGIICFWSSVLIFGLKYAEDYVGIVLLFGTALIIHEFFW